MASFEDTSRYVRIQFFLAVVGFAMLIGAFAVEGHVVLERAESIAFCVLTVVFYLLTVSLSYSWTFIDQARSCKGVYVSNIVFAFLSAIFAIAYEARNIGQNKFSVVCLLFALSILFAILVACFSIAEIAGDVKVTLPKLPSPRKAKKSKDIEAGEEAKKDEVVVELEESPKEGEKKEDAEEKSAEGATNGHVIKEEEEKKEEVKEEKKEEEKKEEAAVSKDAEEK